MSDVNKLIDDLWVNHLVRLTNPPKKVFYARYNLFKGNNHDVVIFNNFDTVGFITLRNSGKNYRILNDSLVVPHEGFSNKLGYGIEVKEKYERRNFGHALLSLGIGVAIKDFNEKGLEDFVVKVSGISSKTHFYESFGFETPGFGGTYNQRSVPDINIVFPHYEY